MKVRLARSAVKDLAQIGRHTRANWGERQAVRYRELLKARFEWLTRNRALWRERRDLGSGIFACREQSHVIVFRTRGEVLEILRVLHVRMDIRQHLRDS